MNEVYKAIGILEEYFNNPDNFKTDRDKAKGCLIHELLTNIGDNFVYTFIEPTLKEKQIIDIGAKA